MTVQGWQAMTWRQRWCGLRIGHDRVLAFVARAHGLPPRMVLRCASCQHDTPGLTPAPRTPVLKHDDGDYRRHLLVPVRLVLRKLA